MTTTPLRPVTQHGFTLVEILVVVVIVAVLAAIALPNYQRYIQRGHRAQARAGLLQAAHWMERGPRPMVSTRKSKPPTRRSRHR